MFIPGKTEKYCFLALKHRFYIISDEIYEINLWENAHVLSLPWTELQEQTILVNGLSKSYAMTGWRIGYRRHLYPLPIPWPASRAMPLQPNSIAQKQHWRQRDPRTVWKKCAVFSLRKDYMLNRLKSFPISSVGAFIFSPYRRNIFKNSGKTDWPWR